MFQSAVWMTDMGINIPWVGLDNEACPYLTNNNCSLTSVLDEGTHQVVPQEFSYPITIQNFYPPVSGWSRAQSNKQIPK